MSTASRLALVALAAPLLSGCVASTAAKIVTAPVRVAGKSVDLMTTSQSEADEKRGRELRKREEEYGKLSRRYRRNTEKCQRGDEDACEDARTDYAEMEDLRGGMPAAY